MENTKKTMNSMEEEQIRGSVFLKFTECPDIPEGVSRKYGDLENDSIGFFSRQGSGEYTKEYISGRYEAQYPFFLRYRTMSTNNEARMRAEKTLEKITAWMEKKENFPELGGSCKVERVRSTSPYIVGKGENGEVDYQVNVTLEYSNKKG